MPLNHFYERHSTFNPRCEAGGDWDGGRPGRKIGSSVVVGKAGPKIFHILRLSSDLGSKRGPVMIFFCTLSTIRISESLRATSAPSPSFNGPRIPFHSMEGRFPGVFALNTLDMGPYLCGADLAAERGQKRPALERPPGM